VNDIITAIAGTPLDETHSYLNTLFLHKPGEQITVDFVREGQALSTQVTLAASNPG
jgi:S1-C subfamily serine protease